MVTVKKKEKCRCENIYIDPQGKPQNVMATFGDWFQLHINSWVSFDVCELAVPRTLPQNAYFHAICTYFGDFTGEEMAYVKKRMKQRFLFKEKIKVFPGTPLEYEEIITFNTSDLSKEDMTDFIDKVIQLMCSMGYNPPTPAQVLTDWKTHGKRYK